MSMIQDFARIEAKKYGMMVFLSDSTGHTSFEEFKDWELVALPSGEVLDAIPVLGTIDRIHSGLLLEAFA